MVSKHLFDIRIFYKNIFRNLLENHDRNFNKNRALILSAVLEDMFLVLNSTLFFYQPGFSKVIATLTDEKSI